MLMPIDAATVHNVQYVGAVILTVMATLFYWGAQAMFG